MSDNSSQSILTQIKKKIDNEATALPRMPQIITKIDRAMKDDTKSVKQIANIVKTDPAIATRLLQVANSPLLRSRDKITTLQTAIVRIGTDVVRNLVFCMAMKDKFTSKDVVLNKILRDVWTESIYVGCYSYVLAKREFCLHADTALLAGIIHKVGVLPVVSLLSTTVHNMQDQDVIDLINELQVSVGVMLLEKWNFPLDFVESVEHCSEYTRDDTRPVAYCDIVTMASVLYNETKLDLNVDALPITQKLKLTKKTITNIMETSQSDIDQILQLLGPDIS